MKEVVAGKSTVVVSLIGATDDLHRSIIQCTVIHDVDLKPHLAALCLTLWKLYENTWSDRG